ncbi:beta,beta-carotene 15,15'-dioxygenase-like, partial [Saccoglossus kowalevskii]
LNVETKEAIYWGPYDNLLPGEPIFVSTPGAVDEDDGVILANVLDTESATGMVVILDGKTFTEIGRAISPELMPFGLHSKFIQQKVDIADPGISSSTYKRASHVVSSVCLFLVIFVQIVI